MYWIYGTSVLSKAYQQILIFYVICPLWEHNYKCWKMTLHRINMEITIPNYCDCLIPNYLAGNLCHLCIFLLLLHCLSVSLCNSIEPLAEGWMKTIDRFTKFKLNITGWNEFNKAKTLWITRILFHHKSMISNGSMSNIRGNKLPFQKSTAYYMQQQLKPRF